MFVDVRAFEVSTTIGVVVSIGVWIVPRFRLRVSCCGSVAEVEDGVGEGYGLAILVDAEIGRASCRERVFNWV